MRAARWVPALLAFPVGGWVAFQLVGDLDGPASGAFGGLIAGSVLGTGQWYALKRHGVGARWIAHTALGMSVGTASAAAVTGSGTTLTLLLVIGLLCGLGVGAAQALLVTRRLAVSVRLAVGSSFAWAVGWATSWAIGVDVERGYYVFGASGALVVTSFTAVVLERLLRQPTAPAGPQYRTASFT